MPKIKHIALSTQDVDKTAKFYIEVFGMKEIAKIDSPGARGYYLSDGDQYQNAARSLHRVPPRVGDFYAGAARRHAAWRNPPAPRQQCACPRTGKAVRMQVTASVTMSMMGARPSSATTVSEGTCR